MLHLSESYADLNARHAREAHEMKARHTAELSELKLRHLEERAAYSARRKAQREVQHLEDFLRYLPDGGKRHLTLEDCRQYAMRARMPLADIIAAAERSFIPIDGHKPKLRRPEATVEDVRRAVKRAVGRE